MLAELTLTVEQLEVMREWFGKPAMTQAEAFAQIKTQHVFRSGNDAFWAWLDSYEEKGTGTGATEAEAVDDLIEVLT